VQSNAVVSSLVAFAWLSVACTDDKPAGPPPSRFAAVKKDDAASAKASSTFCDITNPRGEGGKKMAAFPERPFPLEKSGPPAAGAWTWVNLWATWCHPCVEEMGLLTKWRDSLRKDGVAIDLEMWSVDDDEPALNAYVTKNNMPGRVRWLRSSNDLDTVLESLGAAKGSAIPVHALVDADKNLRCVRIGSVHDEDYAAIKAILTGV
jgi:thiol-disulfide isomerase/thioredoxin